MTARDEAPTDLEIEAFLHDRIDAARRYEIADYLARHPDQAASAMADLRLTLGLRLSTLDIDSTVPDSLTDSAARLGRRIAWHGMAGRLVPAAASVALLVAGWTGHALWKGPMPAGLADALPLAETALDARAALDLHRSLSQVGTAPDAQAVAQALDLTIPSLPPDWKVRDVQVVATPERPGMAIILDTPGMGEIMLFSVARDDPGPDTSPSAFDYRGSAFAVFERARSAYVLVDNSGAPAEVSRGADQLLRRFN